jgi:Icc-related predicted phosphoesterase
MNTFTEKSVLQIVGNPICVEASDGEKIAEVVKSFINEKKGVVLDFLNIQMLTSAFLNTSIGVLYGLYTEEEIKTYLKVKNLQPADIVLLKRVVDTAKMYYKNPEHMEESVKKILDED